MNIYTYHNLKEQLKKSALNGDVDAVKNILAATTIEAHQIQELIEKISERRVILNKIESLLIDESFKDKTLFNAYPGDITVDQ